MQEHEDAQQPGFLGGAFWGEGQSQDTPCRDQDTRPSWDDMYAS